MPFLGSQPAETALSSDDVADNAITLAKLAGGTDGNIISYDASGDPVAIATGTAGHFLKSQGAGSQPVFAAAGGGWEFVSGQSISNAASAAFTGMESGYDYQVIISKHENVSGTTFGAVLGVTGPTYRTSAYEGHAVGINHSGSSASSGVITTEIRMVNQTMDVGTGRFFAFRVHLIDPANASSYTHVIGDYGGEFTGSGHVTGQFDSNYNTTAEAHTAIKFLPASGNIETSELLIYKRSRS